MRINSKLTEGKIKAVKKRILACFIVTLCVFQHIHAQYTGDTLRYGSLRQLGIDSSYLHQQIDSIIQKGITEQAFPGCQILAAYRGQIIFHKAYGFHTYDAQRPVRPDDLYDIASLTKVSAALPALMKLYEQGKIKLDTPMATYWPDFAKNRKRKISVRELLAHQAGLKPYFVFYKRHQKRNGSFRKRFIRTEASENYNIQLTDSLWLRSDYATHIYKRIRCSRLKPRQGYVYSGLPFLIFPEIIRKQTGMPYEQYLYDSLYHPIGAHSLRFNPLEHFPASRIVPTERDSFFRYQLLHGIVHDESAAMLGGISGNAGLFANTFDLAKLLQLYLNGGHYGGYRFLQDSTLKTFSAQQYAGNRRGLGFDKPLLSEPERGYAAPSASKSSYGHSGYTGTMWWVDPEKELIFIFLSNRVYPTRQQRGIYRFNIRPSVHEVFYKIVK